MAYAELAYTRSVWRWRSGGVRIWKVAACPRSQRAVGLDPRSTPLAFVLASSGTTPISLLVHIHRARSVRHVDTALTCPYDFVGPPTTTQADSSDCVESSTSTGRVHIPQPVGNLRCHSCESARMVFAATHPCLNTAFRYHTHWHLERFTGVHGTTRLCIR